MNWEAIGAIGEVVGAIGVIITLGYLAAQVRQNSKVVRSSTRQAISSMQHDTGLRVAENPELAMAARHWVDSRYIDLSIDELRTQIFFRAQLRAYENQFYQHEDGTFDKELWLGYRANMKRSFSAPLAHEFWERNKELYGASFAAFVERELLSPAKTQGSESS